MSVAAGTAFCLVKHLHCQEFALLMAGNNHLGNTLTIINDKIFLRQIDEEYTYLASVVCIHRSRSV